MNPYTQENNEHAGWYKKSKQSKFGFDFDILLILVLVVVLRMVFNYFGDGAKMRAETLADVPAYSDSAYVVINGGEPGFALEDLTSPEPFEYYSELDSLGRCGYALACIGPETMPTEDREDIGDVKPTGWVQAQYEIVSGGNLYNRCHLIGFQLTGENANKQNLITGTRYMNVEGMLPFENLVADYIRETGNHVRYRVTPVYEGDNLVASGVQIEAHSIEDAGEAICLNVYVYNVQPGITIDYATGESWLTDDAA